jgi:hypothetical protein
MAASVHVTVLLHLLLNKLPNDLGFITKNCVMKYSIEKKYFRFISLLLCNASTFLKRSFHSRFNLAHSYQKKANLHANSLNK